MRLTAISLFQQVTISAIYPKYRRKACIAMKRSYCNTSRLCPVCSLLLYTGHIAIDKL